jgi:ubiquinone/menaquinone biosynthesis C-methylase UbiE
MNKESEHTELNQKKWDSKAESYDKRRYDYFRFMQRKTISFIPLRAGDYLLDMGCGTGWAVRYAAGIIKENGKAYGIDLSSRMIEKAKENSSNYQNVSFYQANAEKLPFENNFFDFIICTNSFHHYLNPSKALDEVYRVLKTGGKIFIADVTTDGFIVKMVDKLSSKREPEHVKYYSTQDYKEIFAKAKLKYVDGKFIAYPLKVHIGKK